MSSLITLLIVCVALIVAFWLVDVIFGGMNWRGSPAPANPNPGPSFPFSIPWLIKAILAIVVLVWIVNTFILHGNLG